ncbi:MAG: hypothetical protein IKP95_07990 [Ruminococcus sp.]|nr:hypothetical protein [Ruminococcus sp.]
MLSILPVSFEYRTSLSPKRLARRLDRELTEHRPTLNLMSQGRFMRKHKFESCFYGCRTSADRFQVFHHEAKKRDGGSTGFFGRITETENGSLITGSFRKPVYTYIFGGVWTLVILLISLMAAGMREFAAAGAFAAVWAVGVFFMFWDNKRPIVRAYLENLPAEKQQDDTEDEE